MESWHPKASFHWKMGPCPTDLVAPCKRLDYTQKVPTGYCGDEPSFFTVVTVAESQSVCKNSSMFPPSSSSSDSDES